MRFTRIYMRLKAEKSYKRLTFYKVFGIIYSNKGVIGTIRRSFANILSLYKALALL